MYKNEQGSRGSEGGRIQRRIQFMRESNRRINGQFLQCDELQLFIIYHNT